MSRAVKCRPTAPAGVRSVTTRECTRRVYEDTPRGLGVWCGRCRRSTGGAKSQVMTLVCHPTSEDQEPWEQAHSRGWSADGRRLAITSYVR
jgi:hypothetical protein